MVNDAVIGDAADGMELGRGERRWLGRLLCGVSALATLGMVALLSAYLMSGGVDSNTIAEDEQSLGKFSTAAGGDHKN